jgi:hypothetical protein
MTFDLTRILRHKLEIRQRLAARPIEEKLAMLDALRERELAIRPARRAPDAHAVRKQPLRYRAQRKKTE